MKKVLKVSLLLLALVLIVTAKVFFSMKPREKKQPNIYIFLACTLRPDYLGAYGSDLELSPFLDKLASESILFKNAISAAPYTKPSVSSIFTSKTPVSHRVIYSGNKTVPEKLQSIMLERLPSDEITLAEKLKAAGYKTGSFSFGNPWVSREYGLTQGFEKEEVYLKKINWPAHKAIPSAIPWLKEAKKEGPFFVYFHLLDVHSPYQGYEEDFQNLREKMNTKETSRVLTREEQGYIRKPFFDGIIIGKNGGVRTTRQFGSEFMEVNSWKALYAAGIKRFDKNFSLGWAALEKEGLLEDAIVIFTSDHGEEFFENKFIGHSHSLSNHLLRVPLLIKIPGKKGKRISRLVSTIDIGPTLTEYLGIPWPEAEGENLLTRGFWDFWKKRERVVISSGKNDRPDILTAQDHRRKIFWEADPALLNGLNMKALFEAFSSSTDKIQSWILRKGYEETETKGNFDDAGMRIAEKVFFYLKTISEKTPVEKEDVRKENSKEAIESLKGLGYLN